MTHIVQPGESLSSIALRTLNDGSRWPEIARLNAIVNPDLILVGQSLRLPDERNAPPAGRSATMETRPGGLGRPDTRPSLVPANSYVFVLADEIDPLRRKVVRRVIVSPKMATEVSARIGKPLTVNPNPERFGFTATDPTRALSPGRHAQGITPTPFLSASRTQPFGARRMTGSPFWIDEAKARASGATFHEADEIVADLRKIIARTKNAEGRARLTEVIGKVHADREVLLRGRVPAAAIKGPLAMGMTRGLQGVQIIGFAMTAVDLTHAAQKSQATGSTRPLAAETVRQAGGWAAAWAGMKLGGMAGAAVGITTGPGAVVTGAVGAIAGGFAGYYSFDCIADHIDEN